MKTVREHPCKMQAWACSPTLVTAKHSHSLANLTLETLEQWLISPTITAKYIPNLSTLHKVMEYTSFYKSWLTFGFTQDMDINIHGFHEISRHQVSSRFENMSSVNGTACSWITGISITVSGTGTLPSITKKAQLLLKNKTLLKVYLSASLSTLRWHCSCMCDPLFMRGTHQRTAVQTRRLCCLPMQNLVNRWTYKPWNADLRPAEEWWQLS